MSGGVHCGGVLLSTVAKEKEVSGGNFQDFFFSGADIMPLCLLLAPPRFSLVSLEIGRSLLLDLVGQGVDLEAVQTGNKLVGRSLWPVLRMHHEEHVGEARPKVGPISVVVSGGLGGVDVHALWAVELHHRLSRDIRQPNWHHWLVLAVHPGAVAKVASLVLLNHLGDPPVRQNVSCVDKPIEHLSCLFDQIGLVGVVLQLVVRLQIEDHVERLPIVRYLLVQPSKVELVLNVIFIHLAEELISAETAEPRDPGNLLRAGHLPLERRSDGTPTQRVTSVSPRPGTMLL